MNDRQTILITGATDGIGLALAQQYHARNARLLLIGRRPDTCAAALTGMHAKIGAPLERIAGHASRHYPTTEGWLAGNRPCGANGGCGDCS